MQKSYIKTLYFNNENSPKSSRFSKPLLIQSPRRNQSINSTNSPKQKYENSFSEAIKEKNRKKQEKENLKYLNYPLSLPVIVQKNSLIKTKNTLNIFKQKHENEFESNKKYFYPRFSKNESLDTIKNAESLNRLNYLNKKKRKDSHKMFSKELWEVSYHNKVLNESGISKLYDNLNKENIKSNAIKLQEFQEFMTNKIGRSSILDSQSFLDINTTRSRLDSIDSACILDKKYSVFSLKNQKIKSLSDLKINAKSLIKKCDDYKKEKM